MRKHFLILMLIALLPMAGWANPEGDEWDGFADLSDGWSIELANTALTYTGEDIRPDVFLVKTVDNHKYWIGSENFIVSWSHTNVVDYLIGGYTVTVTSDETNTWGELAKPTAKFMIMKANTTQKTAGVKADDHGWDGTFIPLVETAPTARLANVVGSTVPVQYYVTASDVTEETFPETVDADWKAEIPTRKSVGEYKVWWRVAKTSNYNGYGPVSLGSVQIEGEPLVIEDDYTAPEGITDLKFIWQSPDGKPQTLITAGSVEKDEHDKVKGTMKYRFKKDAEGEEWSGWSETKPAAAAVGTYNIQYMIEPAEGYTEVAATDIADVEIEAIQPGTVNSAVGETGLKYQGDVSDPQALIKTAGSASDGATVNVKYKFRWKAVNEENYADEWDEIDPVAKDAVLGRNAGTYEIKTLVVEGGNYLEKEATSTITVTIAQAKALEGTPTAAKPTWNNDDQQLINAASKTVSGKVIYILEAADGLTPGHPAVDAVESNKISDIVAKMAGSYSVKYKVTDPNYVNIDPTPIADVIIKKKVLTVKANNISKTFNNNFDLTDANTTVDNNLDRFDLYGLVEGTEDEFEDFVAAGANNYVALDEDCVDADTYVGALTIDPEAAGLNAINEDNDFCYEFNIEKGNLTVNQAEVTVTAADQATLTTMFGVPLDISHLYTLNDDLPETNPFKDGKEPILTSEAAEYSVPEPDDYALSFIPGELKANYKMSEDGYVIADGLVFKVTEDPDRKVIITVINQYQKYTGVKESWANPQEGTHYLVAGLIAGDKLKTNPTLTRSDADNVNAGIYTLTAAGAKVNDETKYPGGIIYNSGKFTIQPVELTATVDQQTIYATEGVEAADEAIANAALDQTAWNVTGLVNNETLAVLKGKLTVNNVGDDDGETDISTDGFYDEGIVLEIENDNYTLKAGTEYAILRVITAETVELDPTNTKLAELIEAKKFVEATNNKYNVTFAHKALKADRWYTMVLPFDVKTTELVNQLKDENGAEVYAIVNRLSESSTADHIKYTLEMKEIPANEPFLIKAASDVNLQDVTFATKKIIYTATPSVGGDDFAGNQFVGVYTATSIKNGTPANTVYGFLGDPDKATGMKNEWYQPGKNAWTVNPMEAYLIYSPNKTVSAPLITVEDFGGQTTAISTVNSDIKVISTDGWYTINGVKLQGAPTEKGIYINNGKKIVVK